MDLTFFVMKSFVFTTFFFGIIFPLEFPTVLIWFRDIILEKSHHVLLVLLQSCDYYFL
jgi:hypothetical protein